LCFLWYQKRFATNYAGSPLPACYPYLFTLQRYKKYLKLPNISSTFFIEKYAMAVNVCRSHGTAF